MARSAKALLVLVCFAVLVAAAPRSHVPKTNTWAAITAYVREAAHVVEKHGPASCAVLATPQWKAGEHYIFVVGPDNRILCHPLAAEVGKLESDVVNARGEKIGQKIVQAAKGGGSGWIDYFWARPGKSEEEAKSAYVMGVYGPGGEHYIVGAGAWKVK